MSFDWKKYGLYLIVIFIVLILGKCAFGAEVKPGSQEVKPQVRLCTGPEDGVYDDAGRIIKRWASNRLDIVLINTDGTVNNIEKTRDGECDAFIGQPDGLIHVAKTSPQIKQQIRSVGSLHREYLQVLCNKNSGISDLGDMDGTDKKLDVGAPGSGAWTTWQNILTEDDTYASIKTQSDGGDLALAAVSSGDTDCMLVASGLHSGIMNNADTNYSDSVSFVGANDKDFDDSVGIDGKPIYEYQKIKDAYPNLQSGWFSSVKTISWLAGVYVNTDTMDRPTMSKFIQTVSSARSEIIGKYGK